MTNERYSRKPDTAYPTTNMLQNPDRESAGYVQAQLTRREQGIHCTSYTKAYQRGESETV